MKNFSPERCFEILDRTSAVLGELLRDLPEAWTHQNEGAETWSAFDVVGHLVHGERTDWLARIKKIMQGDGHNRFEPFDRFAQFHESKGKTMHDLLDEFSTLRKSNLDQVRAMELSDPDLQRQGVHPSFGPVTLQHLLSTWAAHDLSHIAQIARVMAKQLREEVGPWKEYMPVMQR